MMYDGWVRLSPVYFALGAIQYLNADLVRVTPVNAGLFGLVCVACRVIHTHPAHLQSAIQNKNE